MDDNVCVDCATCREAISARMDGEADDTDLLLIDAHLPTCPACTAWEAQASGVTRSIRVRPVDSTPDLSAAILVAAAQETPASTRPPLPRWRIALGAVGLAQLVLGLSQLLGVDHGSHGDTGAHLFNESTAWNIALGIGFVAAAVWAKLAIGLLPTLTVFTLVLVGVSVVDVVNGQVDVSRLTSHALILLGLGLLLRVSRQHERGNDPGVRQGLPQDHRYSPMDDMPEDSGPMSAPRRGHLRPASRRSA